MQCAGNAGRLRRFQGSFELWRRCGPTCPRGVNRPASYPARSWVDRGLWQRRTRGHFSRRRRGESEARPFIGRARGECSRDVSVDSGSRAASQPGNRQERAAAWPRQGIALHTRSGHRPLYAHLYFQVLVAIAIGVTLGYFYPAAATAMKPLGDGFIKLIKMMIAPIIFTTVVVGIAKIGDMKKVGRVGLKALIYFELVSTLALVIGLVVVNVVRPGAGINADVQTLDANEVAAYTGGRKPLSTVEHLLHIIPDSAVGAFTGGEILQVLTFSVLFGLALGGFGDKGSSAGRSPRPAVARPLRRHRDHHAARPARRLRRDGVHHRQVRRRHACSRWAR